MAFFLSAKSYTYDDNGNITRVVQDGVETAYTYDALGQLTQVDDGHEGATWVYEYDQGGNILSKKKFVDGVETESMDFEYTNENWRDQLTKVNGTTITYDKIGNPLNDGEWTYTWQNGRQLARMQSVDTDASFIYNENGLRIQKTVNNVVTKYTLHGKNIVHMTQGSNELHFFYDAQNKPAIVVYNGTPYSYVKNLQGDIVAILDSDKNVVVKYVYDAWGRHISKTGSMAGTLGTVQPFRYRGYVYDEETGGYYLRNRYYEPEWCRFLNADMYISRNLLNNVFAYCASSPVRLIDPKGTEYFDLYDEDADEKRGGYDTADEAAIAFYEEFYPKSMYTLVEYGGKIYSREIKGVTRYFYSQPLIGETHSVSPIDTMIDNGVSLVALVHTHPSYNGFSEPDYKYSKDHGINLYVVGPNLLVQCYDYMIDKITDIGIIKFQKLTAEEKKFLEKTYRYKWENHFQLGECYLGYDCIESDWPNETY